MTPRKVACVGSGTIGSSWALLFALKGHDVITYDVNDEVLSRSAALTSNMLDTMVGNEIIDRDQVKPALAKVRSTTRLEDISGSDYVQESALERLDVKIGLLGKLEEVVGEGVTIASSTSGLPITAMQEGMRHPERAVIAHPFNPPHLVPLVEIVRGEKTSQATVDDVYTLMESLGKVPVRVNKQLPGFAANRLQTAVLRESMAMLAEGVVDADGLEKIMNAGIGLRWAFMGPLLTASLAGGPGGLDYYFEHFGPLTKSICETLSTWTTFPEDAKNKAASQLKSLPVVRERQYAELVKWRDQNLIEIMKERGYLPTRS
jgi:3-hydroxypropionate dehydrogenase (NADP+)